MPQCVAQMYPMPESAAKRPPMPQSLAKRPLVPKCPVKRFPMPKLKPTKQLRLILQQIYSSVTSVNRKHNFIIVEARQPCPDIQRGIIMFWDC